MSDHVSLSHQWNIYDKGDQLHDIKYKINKIHIYYILWLNPIGARD